jgi:hypothetical protein
MWMSTQVKSLFFAMWMFCHVTSYFFVLQREEPVEERP